MLVPWESFVAFSFNFKELLILIIPWASLLRPVPHSLRDGSARGLMGCDYRGDPGTRAGSLVRTLVHSR